MERGWILVWTGLGIILVSDLESWILCWTAQWWGSRDFWLEVNLWFRVDRKVFVSRMLLYACWTDYRVLVVNHWLVYAVGKLLKFGYTEDVDGWLGGGIKCCAGRMPFRCDDPLLVRGGVWLDVPRWRPSLIFTGDSSLDRIWKPWSAHWVMIKRYRMRWKCMKIWWFIDEVSMAVWRGMSSLDNSLLFGGSLYADNLPWQWV